MPSYEGGILSVPSIEDGIASPSLGAIYAFEEAEIIYQRVWSTGLSAWCYYVTYGQPLATPAPTETSPNWTGSISNHEILARI